MPGNTYIPTKVSDLDNDEGYLTEESDPTVPEWAKQATKPSYTASEVGALPSTTHIPEKVSELQNDSGFITGYTETDPTVPSWAKQPTKPTYTAAEVGALPDTTVIPTKVSDLTDDSGHYTKPANGIPASDLAETYVKTTDYANEKTIYGIVKAGNGLYAVDGTMQIERALAEHIKAGNEYFRPIVPNLQHAATFYGLAKAAGDTSQASSDNAVGTYTADAKTAIQSMLGLSDVVRNTDYATSTTGGVVKTNEMIGLDSSGRLNIIAADSTKIKNGVNAGYPLMPIRQHESVFYGLAKAAGDTTQSASSNAVGNYTDNAKAKIKGMLGIDEVVTEQVSGASPVITAQANHRYICGEVTSISITPCASGICDVVFTSGSTVAVLTLPSTVKMPEWWDGTLEANMTYEINVMDGVYGTVMAWTA